MPSTVVTAAEVGANMRRWFQGWHEASTSAVGRTAIFKPARGSATEAQIREVIRARGGVSAASPQVAPLAADTDLMTPIYVRIRGGTTTSAATLCKIEGYVAPTELYISAKTRLLSALNRHAVVYNGLPSSAVAGSFIKRYPVGNATAVPAAFEALPLYVTALRLASDVVQSAQPQWRDPRSRAETAKQFAAAVRELAERVPLATGAT